MLPTELSQFFISESSLVIVTVVKSFVYLSIVVDVGIVQSCRFPANTHKFTQNESLQVYVVLDGRGAYLSI